MKIMKKKKGTNLFIEIGLVAVLLIEIFCLKWLNNITWMKNENELNLHIFFFNKRSTKKKMLWFCSVSNSYVGLSSRKFLFLHFLLFVDFFFCSWQPIASNARNNGIDALYCKSFYFIINSWLVTKWFLVFVVWTSFGWIDWFRICNGFFSLSKIAMCSMRA